MVSNGHNHNGIPSKVMQNPIDSTGSISRTHLNTMAKRVYNIQL